MSGVERVRTNKIDREGNITFFSHTMAARCILLFLARLCDTRRLRALKLRQTQDERKAAHLEKGWEGRAGGLEIRLPPAGGATGGARSRSGGAQTDTAEDMVAMQRRAAKEGVNLEFTESPLFPRPKR